MKYHQLRGESVGQELWNKRALEAKIQSVKVSNCTFKMEKRFGLAFEYCCLWQRGISFHRHESN